MASKVFDRCSESRALNSAMSSDTLPQANTGPGILIGDTHCEGAMLSPAGPDCERYRALRGGLRSLVMVVGQEDGRSSRGCCNAASAKPKETADWRSLRRPFDVISSGCATRDWAKARGLARSSLNHIVGACRRNERQLEAGLGEQV